MDGGLIEFDIAGDLNLPGLRAEGLPGRRVTGFLDGDSVQKPEDGAGKKTESPEAGFRSRGKPGNEGGGDAARGSVGGQASMGL